MPDHAAGLIEEAWLMEWDVEFAVNSGENALHLPQGEHTSEERVSGVVSLRFVAEHRHAVIHTHRELRILLLEDAAELDDVCTTAEVTCLCEVAVREDMA